MTNTQNNKNERFEERWEAGHKNEKQQNTNIAGTKRARQIGKPCLNAILASRIWAMCAGCWVPGPHALRKNKSKFHLHAQSLQHWTMHPLHWNGPRNLFHWPPAACTNRMKIQRFALRLCSGSLDFNMELLSGINYAADPAKAKRENGEEGERI